MARIPGLIWRPLPENATQPRIRPTQWIVHTAVDGSGPTNLGNYFERADITLESHTWLRWDRHEQLLDTEIRGDANYRANRRPDGTGAVSTETEDDGTPVERPWNAYQLDELVRTGVELHRLHGIPVRLCRTHDDPGMGYHSMFPGVWSNVAGKTCPGATRIKQFRNEVLPAIARAVAEPAPPEEDDPMPQVVWYKTGDPNAPAAAYQVAGLLGKWLTEPGLTLCRALKVPEIDGGQPGGQYFPLDATWRDTAVLVDGPCRTVPIDVFAHDDLDEAEVARLVLAGLDTDTLTDEKVATILAAMPEALKQALREGVR